MILTLRGFFATIISDFNERNDSMLLLDDLRIELEGYRPLIKELYSVLEIEKALAETEELKEVSAAPDFWNDLENSQKVLSKIKKLENKIALHKNLDSQLEDCLAYIEIVGDEEPDEETLAEIQKNATDFKNDYETCKLTTLLSGEYDSSNAILTFHAGAG